MYRLPYHIWDPIKQWWDSLTWRPTSGEISKSEHRVTASHTRVTLFEMGTSKQEEMVYIQEQHESLADFQRLRPTTTTKHLCGEMNFLADLFLEKIH